MRIFCLVLALSACAASSVTAEENPPAAAQPRAGDDVVKEGDDARRGPFWAPLLTGAGVCVGFDAVGGVASLVGCGLAHASPGSSGDNTCVEDCIFAIVSAGIAVVGIVLGAVGLVLLGPLAALAVTGAATIASALAGRAFWGAALGGAPGILSGIAGLALVVVGFSDMDIDSGGLQPGLFSGDPGANLALGGVALLAAAGPLALAGALGGELISTSLLEDDGGDAAGSAESRRARPGELPLAYVQRGPGVAY